MTDTPATSPLHPLHIGSLALPGNQLLAPMAGYTNLPFRLIIRRVGGCALGAIEMVAALSQDQRRHCDRFALATALHPEEGPTAMQVYGRDPQRCAVCAAELEAAGAAVVDLNCGCPVRKARQAGCGISLMRDPPLIGRILSAMRAAIRVPLMVKIRLGYDQSERTGLEVARRAVDAGVDAITVHARTGASRHGEAVDLDGLAAIASAVPVPVIANGDQHDSDILRRSHTAGAAGFMIGRGAIGHPDIFAGLAAELVGRPVPAFSLEHRLAWLREHVALTISLYGAERGIRTLRRTPLLYCAGQPGVRRLRERWITISTIEDIENIIAELRAHPQDRDTP